MSSTCGHENREGVRFCEECGTPLTRRCVSCGRAVRSGCAPCRFAAPARAHGIADADEIRVWNDMGEFFVPAKVAPHVMPGQVIVYNG